VRPTCVLVTSTPPSLCIEDDPSRKYTSLGHLMRRSRSYMHGRRHKYAAFTTIHSATYRVSRAKAFDTQHHCQWACIPEKKHQIKQSKHQPRVWCTMPSSAPSHALQENGRAFHHQVHGHRQAPLGRYPVVTLATCVVEATSTSMDPRPTQHKPTADARTSSHGLTTGCHHQASARWDAAQELEVSARQPQKQ